ncbi:MAG: acylneuraminate cytidylyltransferase, partial [Candidatus Sumerlaeota bacterium]|nr:acylneuraminate cytidylyltransferase [Candidatus Sumerlaeota bacterium]
MQARVSSVRLPAKILKHICGKSILEHDIERCLRIRCSSGIIIATTHEPGVQEIIKIAGKFPSEKVFVYHGSMDDVLERYYCAARQYHVDIIVRLTSDNPLLDPMLVDLMLERFMELDKTRGVDYLANNLIP